VKSFGVDSIHLIVHSKGGLDSREYLANVHGPGGGKDFTVLSYTSLSTPHNGSVGADLLIQRDIAVASKATLDFQNFPTFTQTVLDSLSADAGTPDLQTTSTAAFNTTNIPQLPTKTIFNTVAADADQNGNGEIDRTPDEYAELRAESAQLTAIDNKTVLGVNVGRKQTQIAINVAYQILRHTASVTLAYTTKKGFFGGTKTIATLTSVPTSTALGNDVLVTIPSGQGLGSIGTRTTNTTTFTGAQGRNHSSIANAGVAATVIPWIIQIEKTLGDLK
jgi:hypothetical protein